MQNNSDAHCITSDRRISAEIENFLKSNRKPVSSFSDARRLDRFPGSCWQKMFTDDLVPNLFGVTLERGVAGSVEKLVIMYQLYQTQKIQFTSRG